MSGKLELIIEDDSTTRVVNIEDNPRLSDTIPLSTTIDNQLTRVEDGYYVPPTSWEGLRDKPTSTTEEIDGAVSRSEQNSSSIEDLEQSKVDKVVGKQLSTENYSTAEKNKLGGIESGAQVNSVTSVAGKTGAVTLNRTDVGLPNVDDTSDSDKPVSTPQQAALNLKLNADANAVSASKLFTPRTISLSGDASGSTSFDGSANTTIVVEVVDDSHNHVISNVDGLQTSLDGKVDKVFGKQLSDENYTLVEKNKLAGVAVEATKNATDAQLRDRATHTGVQPIASVEGLQDALGGKVVNTDPRLSDAREWTASIVAQAEAEAGTSTTAYKWTSQRVRQSILGWWNTSTFKAKLDGIEAGATKNSTDAQLRERATHTGVQAIDTVSGLQGELDSINTLIGDVASALDAINGEVV